MEKFTELVNNMHVGVDTQLLAQHAEMMCLVCEDAECIEKCFSLSDVDFDTIPLDFRVVLYQVLASANHVIDCGEKHG
jgi:hypothetical protein